MYFSDAPQIEEISINKMITNYKNIKPSFACVFVQNGNSCRLYKGIECKKCEFSINCTKRKDGIRHLKIAEFFKERKQLADKMKTEEAKKIYGQRKQVVEPVIGNYKENIGFREFLTRGLKSARNEFNLVCTAINLRKIWIYSNKKEIARKESMIKCNFSL